MSTPAHRGLHIFATGTQIAATTVSASVALPNNSAGVLGQHVLVQADGLAYVKLTVGSTTAATVNDLMVNSTYPLMLVSGGADHLAALASTGTVHVNVLPVESAG